MASLCAQLRQLTDVRKRRRRTPQISARSGPAGGSATLVVAGSSPGLTLGGIIFCDLIKWSRAPWIGFIFPLTCQAFGVTPDVINYVSDE